MGGSLPPLPNYPTDPNQPGSTGGTVNPNDIWDLGRLYNVPIYQRTDKGQKAKRGTNAPPFPEGDLDTHDHNVFAKAQDVVAGYYNAWVRGTAGKNPDAQAYQQYINLQKSLYYAGFYGQVGIKEVHAGQWTTQTQTALKDALTAYYGAEHAGVPVTFDQFLEANSNGAAKAGGGFYQDGAGALGKGGSGGSSRPALMDPDTLKAQAQSAAANALGHVLTGDELNAFVNEFHNQQTASFNASANGQGDAVDKSDPVASAIQYVTSTHNKEFQQHQVVGYADALLNELMSGSSQLPTPNTDSAVVMNGV